jgi:hypothetical protein
MNESFIRIKGNAVELVTERVNRTVTLEDLLVEVSKDLGFRTPILPFGCRYCAQKGDKTVFVIEQVPQVRTLNWTDMDDGGDKWKLGFPYVVFVIVFRGEAVSTWECKVFYRNQPLGNGNGEDDRLYRVNLANVYDHGEICTGDMRVSGTTLAAKAESFVAEFWRSWFNHDLTNETFFPAAEKNPQVASLEKWQEETRKNPLFPLEVKWIRARNLSEVMSDEPDASY